MKEFLKKVWRYGRWVLLLLVVAYIALVIYRVYAIGEEERSAETVAVIHAQKITRDFVLNTNRNLPEPPDPATNDATVEGFDTNNNGIRDDAELTIFLWHRDSARIRAAELQYAMTIQSMLTKVFDSNTWVAAAQEDGRAFNCIYDVAKDDDTQAQFLLEETKKLVLDTGLRRKKFDEVYKYQVSYTLLRDSCDVDLNSLSN